MDEEYKVTATWAKLMEDGASAAKYYMSCAVTEIDEMFGKGYAAAHPELVGAFMRTAATETHGSVLCKCMQLCTEEISHELSLLSECIINSDDDDYDYE